LVVGDCFAFEFQGDRLLVEGEVLVLEFVDQLFVGLGGQLLKSVTIVLAEQGLYLFFGGE
jgi:hypothetical protein